MAIKDNTNAILKESRRLTKQKLELAAILVERTAKELVSVDTGTLRRSITHKISSDGRSAKVGTNIDKPPYPIYLELGTSKMAARPYLRPALETNWNEIKRLFGAR